MSDSNLSAGPRIIDYDEQTKRIERIARKLPNTDYFIQTWDQIAAKYIGKNCKFEGNNSSANCFTLLGQIAEIYTEKNHVIIKLTSGTLFAADLNEHNNYWRSWPDKTKVGTITMTTEPKPRR